MRWYSCTPSKILKIALCSTILGMALYASPDAPYLVESKVQGDLDSALSRLIPREQFLVLVTTEINNKVERKLIEGETIANPRQGNKPEVVPMPGFLPEADLEPEDHSQQTRQLYRVVETPVLVSVRVHVSFDLALPADTLARGKQIVQNYLRSTHPSRAMLTFDQIPMIQPKTDKDKNKDEAKPSPIQKQDPDEPWWAQYIPVGIIAVLALLALAFTRGRGGSAAAESSRRSSRDSSVGPEDRHNPYAYPFSSRSSEQSERRSRERSSEPKKSVDQTESEHALVRKRVLERFLSRPEAFRIYFNRLTEQGRAELCSALKGPALENLLLGLGLARPKGDDFIPPDLGEYLEKQEKDFAEYVQAKDWQDRQFFGFLHEMTDRQLQTLATQGSVLQTAAMLRFMKPQQSARMLEGLPADRRRDVIAKARELSRAPFSELEVIEREIRAVAVRLPNQGFSAAKGDIDFWGSILTETQDQESILQDLEHTNPGISPDLKRYKFKLEDAASLPDSLLEKILSDADNEELGLALVTCPEPVIDVILDAISPRRRDFVLNQLESFRQAPNELAVQARQTLTKRFREVLA